jgi:sphingolipid delta-4 desaturase
LFLNKDFPVYSNIKYYFNYLTMGLKENSSLLEMPKEIDNKPATDMIHFDKDYNYFHVMEHTEPHTIRNRKIMEKYPEIEKLFKRDPFTLAWVIGIHICQMAICSAIVYFNISWGYVALVALLIGAIFNHALFVLIHDITHYNCFASKRMNDICAIFANLPQIIPSAIGFRIYHRDHHHFLGDSINDPDIPTVMEIKLNRNVLTRLLYIILMPLFYGLRPYFKAPKPVSLWERINIAACAVYILGIYSIFGGKALVYLILCTYFGLSIHPVGAHVIAEHYEFSKGQDTYSYYGWINYLNFNMGYHIEHHDFPNIPWSRLPEVRKIAPEFYNTLPTVDSYVKVIFKYIFDGSLGPWSRIALKK